MKRLSESPEVQPRPTLAKYAKGWLQFNEPNPQLIIGQALRQKYGRPVSSQDEDSSKPAEYTYICSECHQPTLVWPESDYSGFVDCRNSDCKFGQKTLREIDIVKPRVGISDEVKERIRADYIVEYGPLGFDGDTESIFSNRNARAPIADIGVPMNIMHAIWKAGSVPPLIQYKEFQRELAILRSDFQLTRSEFNQALDQLSRVALVQELRAEYADLNLIKAHNSNVFYYRVNNTYSEWQEINEEKLFESLIARVYRHPTQSVRWNAKALLKDQSRVLKELLIPEGRMDQGDSEATVVPIRNGFIRFLLGNHQPEFLPFERRGSRVFDSPREMKTWRFTYALSVAGIPKSERSNLWDKATGDWFPDWELRREFIKMCFYILSGEQSAQKAFILFGSGGEGKTVISELLQDIIGKQYVGNVTYDNILASDFAVSDLHGKLLNVIGEVTANKPIPSAVFKMLVGHDQLSANVKHRERKVFTNKARLLILTNHHLPTSDFTRGFFRRIIYFPIEKSKQNNPNLIADLVKEKNAIFHSIMNDGLKYWNEDLREFRTTKGQLECLIDTYTFSDPVASFLRDSWADKISDNWAIPILTPANNIMYLKWDDAEGKGHIDPAAVYPDYIQFAAKHRYPGLPYSTFVTNLRLFVEYIFPPGCGYTTKLGANRFKEGSSPRKVMTILSENPVTAK